MIFVYRRSNSTGARELADALGAARVKRFEGGVFYRRRLEDAGRRAPQPLHPRRGDLVVSWGEALPAITGVSILNGGNLRTKFEDAVRLREAGVSTVQVSRTRPAPIVVVPAQDPAIALWTQAQERAEAFTGATLARTSPMTTGIAQLIDSLTQVNRALNVPFTPPTPGVDGTWIPRMNAHVGGNDLLRPPSVADYYSRKEDLVREYRVHVFNGRSIRAGQKALREGYSVGTPNGTRTASPWIRAYEAGWRIVYDGFESSRQMRELSFAACEALGLDFGAVDVGQRADGTLVVLEVNRAAGLEGGTVGAYASAITRYLEEQDQPATQPRSASRAA